VSALEKVRDRAIARITADADALAKRLDDAPNPSIREFVTQFLSWTLDGRRSTLLWNMFDRVIDLSETAVLGGLNAFVANALQYDSAFEIVWVAPLYKYRNIGTEDDPLEIPELQYDDGGRIITEEVGPAHPNSCPEVRITADGSQSPDLLLFAMRLYDEKDLKQRAEIDHEMTTGDE